MKKITFTFLILFFNGSCMSIQYEYKYISLEALADVHVVSHGRSELVGLKFDREMPVSYELNRNHYVLLLELDKKSYWPSMLVSSKSSSGIEFIIEPVVLGDCGGFDGLDIDYKINNLQAMRYEWSPAFRKNCNVKDNNEFPIQQVISFKIKNQKGKVVGEEELPFSLIKNGTYYEKDSL